MALLTLTVQSKNGTVPSSAYTQVFESAKMYDIIANTNYSGGSTESYPILPGSTQFSIETIDGAFDWYTVTEDFTSIVTAADGTIKKATVLITTAEILALHGAPKEIVAAPGAGKAIIPISGLCDMTYVSAAYATQTDLNIVHAATPTVPYFTAENFLDITASASALFKLSSLGTTEYVLTANSALQVIVPTAEAVTGDSDVTVTVYYQEVTI